MPPLLIAFRYSIMFQISIDLFSYFFTYKPQPESGTEIP